MNFETRYLPLKLCDQLLVKNVVNVQYKANRHSKSLKLMRMKRNFHEKFVNVKKRVLRMCQRSCQKVCEQFVDTRRSIVSFPLIPARLFSSTARGGEAGITFKIIS